MFHRGSYILQSLVHFEEVRTQVLLQIFVHIDFHHTDFVLIFVVLIEDEDEVADDNEVLIFAILIFVLIFVHYTFVLFFVHY